jgi:putative tricarboxylic transport membrane protein
MSEDVNSSQKRPHGGLSIRNPRDFWGGLVMVLVAILALWASRDLPGQRGFAFGPGTAPRLFSGLLAVIGAAVAVVGLFTDGEPIGRYKLRGPAFVLFSIVLFAIIIRPLGLIVSSFLAFMFSIMGSAEMRWMESVIAAAVLTAGCWFLFNYILLLPFQNWPPDNAHLLLLREFEDFFKSVVSMFHR